MSKKVTIAIERLGKVRKYLSISAIAKEMGYDVSNLHKVIDGKNNLPEKHHKLFLKIVYQIFGSSK